MSVESAVVIAVYVTVMEMEKEKILPPPMPRPCVGRSIARADVDDMRSDVNGRGADAEPWTAPHYPIGGNAKDRMVVISQDEAGVLRRRHKQCFRSRFLETP